MAVKEFLESGEGIINAEKSLKNKKSYDEIDIVISPENVAATLKCKAWKSELGFCVASAIKDHLSNFKYRDKHILDCDFVSWKIESGQLIVEIK